MWLRQLILAITCTSFLTLARPAALQEPDDTVLQRREEDRDRDKGLPKYFHEPGYSIIGAHYDSRYFKGENNYVDRRLTQTYMLRAYFTFFAEKDMETWIAHGTLLGWWWNGKMLPWDWDIDTQVSESTLKYMGIHHNHTMYEYTAVDDPAYKRTYLLDVNPAIDERVRGNGKNVIDARFIDTSNGLYIDITGLSETRPDDQPGIWSCKNYHRYHTTDLYPMRETVFEGITAKVPYAYDRLLMQEYNQKALVVTEYEGHRWDPDLKEWMKKSDEEIAAEKEALKNAKLKQKFAKQRFKAEKLRQKHEAEKQAKLKLEEEEKAKQDEATKPEVAQLEEANKHEAAGLDAALSEEKKQEEGSPQQATPSQENKQPESPQPNLPQPDPPAPGAPHPDPPRRESAPAKPPPDSDQQ